MSSPRRPMGTLELAVLAKIWDEPGGLTPRGVLERLDGDLAYTTVMTIMNRLWNKGVLERVKEGRAYRYRPLRTESEVIAAKMSEVLGIARDREASLSQFVEDLAPGDEAMLRSLLEEGI